METVKVRTKSHHNVNFKVSLSNGETFYEGKGDYQVIAGELSPWKRLIQYTIDKKLLITSLSLYTDDGRTFNLPSSGKNPKFKIFDIQDKPIDFNFFRHAGSDVGEYKDGKLNVAFDNEPSDDFNVIEAIYPKYRLQLWVDDLGGNNCWVMMIPNA